MGRRLRVEGDSGRVCDDVDTEFEHWDAVRNHSGGDEMTALVAVLGFAFVVGLAAWGLARQRRGTKTTHRSGGGGRGDGSGGSF